MAFKALGTLVPTHTSHLSVSTCTLWITALSTVQPKQISSCFWILAHAISICLPLPSPHHPCLPHTYFTHLINSFLLSPICLSNQINIIPERDIFPIYSGKMSLDSWNIPCMFLSNSSHTTLWPFTCLFLQLECEHLEGRDLDLFIRLSLLPRPVPAS